MTDKFEIFLKDGTVLFVEGNESMLIVVFNHIHEVMSVRRIVYDNTTV